MKSKKYIIVTGSVSSGIGKGIIVSSLAKIFDSMGYHVCPIKFDGFFNLNLETMNPYHKKPKIVWKNEEVFISHDGIICDSDIGLYERFLCRPISGKNNLTNGNIFKKFLKMNNNTKCGELIKIRPHLVKEYLREIKKLSKNSDIVIIEVGGTVGEDENLFFLKAMKKLLLDHKQDSISIHISYIPFTSENIENSKNDISCDTSYKLKPVMIGVDLVSSLGLHPDILIWGLRTPSPP